MELVSDVKESVLRIHVKMEVYAKKDTILSHVIAGKFSIQEVQYSVQNIFYTY
jgi:hypothetical protein